MRFEYDSDEEGKMTKKPRKQRDPDFSNYKKSVADIQKISDDK